jgi:hypothetical protein
MRTMSNLNIVDIRKETNCFVNKVIILGLPKKKGIILGA